MTRQLPSLTGPQWHQGQSPRLCPLWLQGPSGLPFSLSWQSFPMSRTLHPGIGLRRCLRPPSHTLALSRPLARHSGVGVPQFQDRRRVEIPVAACSTPGVSGTTSRRRGTRLDPTPYHFGPGVSAIFTCADSRRLCRFLFVTIGIRSGWSTLVWLRVATLVSLGFPPSRVPLVNAGQVDLTPLFMCNSLHELSLCPVKGRTPLNPGECDQVNLCSAIAFQRLIRRLWVTCHCFSRVV